MPNHVTNIVRANPVVIHGILAEFGVDFERVIPMPEHVLRGGIGHAKIDGVMQKAVFEQNPEFPNDPTKTIPRPYPEGAVDWYDWSIKNWGTKWNAYDTEVSEDETVVRFDTAWSHPYPVMVAWSRKYPTRPMEVAYADEDLGGNLGMYRMLNGEMYELPIPDDYGPEARQIASFIKYGVPYDEEEGPMDVPGVPAGQLFDALVAGELPKAVRDGS